MAQAATGRPREGALTPTTSNARQSTIDCR